MDTLFPPTSYGPHCLPTARRGVGLVCLCAHSAARLTSKVGCQGHYTRGRAGSRGGCSGDAWLPRLVAQSESLRLNACALSSTFFSQNVSFIARYSLARAAKSWNQGMVPRSGGSPVPDQLTSCLALSTDQHAPGPQGGHAWQQRQLRRHAGGRARGPLTPNRRSANAEAPVLGAPILHPARPRCRSAQAAGTVGRERVSPRCAPRRLSIAGARR